ncbi:MAG: 16S rRNA processing protein RimM [Flavobacteriales bacterium]|jgi:16S rRNA processing protein RimM|nr:16S rRNA processing protein RimM [Flavobacteriales bacterium]MBP9160333.1 16S rRNA processing protein RimM [Flavobacteriales bacterium]
MDLSNLHRVGKLGKPWGNQGELSLHLDGSEFKEVLAMGVLFADIDGQKVPFHVSHFREHPRIGAVVKFEDLDDPQGSAFLVNCDVFAPPGHQPAEMEEEEDEENLNPEDLVGMHVHDEKHGHLGEVTGMEGNEDNPVLVVVKDGVEVLLPMNGDLIQSIALESRRIDVRTPDGLVELYRNG